MSENELQPDRAGSIYPLTVQIDVRGDIHGTTTDQFTGHSRGEQRSGRVVAHATTRFEGQDVEATAENPAEAVEALIATVEATRRLDDATVAVLTDIGGPGLVAVWDAHVRTAACRAVRCDPDEARDALVAFQRAGIPLEEACEWIGAGFWAATADPLHAAGIQATEWTWYLEDYGNYAETLKWYETIPDPVEWASRGVPCHRAITYHRYEIGVEEAMEDWEPVVRGYAMSDYALHLYLATGLTAAAAAKREVAAAAGDEDALEDLEAAVQRHGHFGGRWRLPQ